MANRTKRSVFGARPEGERWERMLACPRFVDGGFRNNAAKTGPGLKSSPLPLLGEFVFGGAQRVPESPPPLISPLAAWSSPAETGFRVTWLGHSTVLLELDGVRILTDPVFNARASPLAFAGPKRFHQPPVALSALPPIDCVLVSHDHYDHLCYPTILELAKRDVPFVTALGVGAHLEAWGVPAARITELDWWEKTTLPGGRLSLTATPSQHFSGRGVGDRNRTLWASWVLQSDRRRVFFSGDTGLSEDQAEIGRRCGPFDLVMLEIGAFHPSWSDIHLGPENALTAHQRLGGGTLLPVHWGTFNLALHAWDEPVETLLSLAEQQRARVLTPRLGAAIEPDRTQGVDPWWREVRGHVHEATAQAVPAAGGLVEKV